MTLSGNLLIGAQEVPATVGAMKALNPATNVEIEPFFAFGGIAEVDRAARLADDAFDSYNNTGDLALNNCTRLNVPIRAWADTVEQKPAFRTSFRRRRCLVPCDGWFEWQQLKSGKQPDTHD